MIRVDLSLATSRLESLPSYFAMTNRDIKEIYRTVNKMASFVWTNAKVERFWKQRNVCLYLCGSQLNDACMFAALVTI